MLGKEWTGRERERGEAKQGIGSEVFSFNRLDVLGVLFPVQIRQVLAIRNCVQLEKNIDKRNWDRVCRTQIYNNEAR